MGWRVAWLYRDSKGVSEPCLRLLSAPGLHYCRVKKSPLDGHPERPAPISITRAINFALFAATKWIELSANVQSRYNTSGQYLMDGHRKGKSVHVKIT